MTGPATQRARLLLQAGRSELALEELARVLAESPGDAEAHALRAHALGDLDQMDAALEAAERATGEAPEWAYPRYVTASLWLRRGKPRPALAAAQEAVALEPEDEDYHAILAACWAGLASWKETIAAAERGLELDAQHVQCTNLRALGLRQLGRTDEAAAALGASLASDPENAWTLQNLGFAALKAGHAEQAIEHFRESLRLDPTDDVSRVGLAESLKARVPLYRPVIAWQMLCSRLSSRLGFGLIIGLLVLNNVIQRVAPDGSVIALVVLVAYASLVWMSWAADALFDVLLLLRADLRALLLPRERVAALGVLVCLLLAGSTLVLQLVTGFPRLEWHAASAAFVAIPMAGWSKLPNGRARAVGVLVAVTALAAALGAFGLDLFVLNEISWDASTQLPEAEVESLRHWVSMAGVLANLALLVSVGSSWLLMGLGFVPESRGGRGTRRRPR